MSKKVDPVKIGTFVVSAILLFIILLVFFSSESIFSHNVRFYTFFDTSLNGLDIGAPVKFKGVRVGSVEAIDIVHDEDTDEACASVLIKINSNAFRTINGCRVVGKDYDEFYAEQIAHGMAAKLSLESVVTGKSFISIDYYPHSSERFFKDIDGFKYQQMPSMPTDLDEFLASVDSIMKGLSKFDFESVGNNINAVLIKLEQELNNVDFREITRSFVSACDSFSNLTSNERVKQILNTTYSILSKFDERVDRSLDNFDSTMCDLSEMLKSDSRFRNNLENSLLQLEKMLRSIREFFDFLERNPNAIFAGKSL